MNIKSAWVKTGVVAGRAYELVKTLLEFTIRVHYHYRRRGVSIMHLYAACEPQDTCDRGRPTDGNITEM